MGLVPSSHRTCHSPGEHLNRHLHSSGYVALVLTGSYVEAGDTGRHRAEAGHVIRHGAYESHLNRFDRGYAEVLVLEKEDCGGAIFGTVSDPDWIMRLAERDAAEALDCLKEQFTPCMQPPEDWPDELADMLVKNPALELQAWAEKRGLHPGSLSRGFYQQFGTTPARFRSLCKFHRARRLITSNRMSLAQIAVEAGFFDQPHMGRTVHKLTGWTPRAISLTPKS